MKKTTVKVLAMATILGLTAAGCQKENLVENPRGNQQGLDPKGGRTDPARH